MNNTAFGEERKRMFRSEIRAMGLKVTPQRQVTFDYLVSSVNHPTAEEIYLEVRKKLPHIPLTSIYRILDQFHDLGVIRKVPSKNSTRRYEANVLPHHHLVCLHCDGIWDIPIEDFASPSLPESNSTGFRISHSEIYFYGRCAECK